MDDDGYPIIVLDDLLNEEDLDDLSDDTLVHLWDALDELIMYTKKAPDFEVIYDVLMAATVLQFPQFRRWAITQLQEMWPEQLDNPYCGKVECATWTIYLADKCDVPSLLKRPLYELLRRRQYWILTDDSVDIPIRFHTPMLTAREGLVNKWDDILLQYPFVNYSTCTSLLHATSTSGEKKCSSTSATAVKCSFHRVVHASGLYGKHIFDPLAGLDALANADWREEGFCLDCLKKAKKAWATKRAALWQELDEWLGLAVTDVDVDEDGLSEAGAGGPIMVEDDDDE